MTVNQAGIDLIKQFESCRLVAYEDGAGIWTLGWGHTHGVVQGQTCTQAQADAWFEEDLSQTAGILMRLVPPTLSDNQFSACVSLAYNVGPGNFQSSTLLKYLKAGDFVHAADQFLVWDKISGIHNPGLQRRRQAERLLFMRAL